MSLNFGKMDFAVSFAPVTAFPLDARSYFESYDSAVAQAQLAVEAGSADGRLYIGQTITVVENGSAQLYQIQPDKTLGAIGGKIEIDEKQFAFVDGKLNILGFAEAVAGAQLTIKESPEGIKSLEWVKPDTSIVEGLSTRVTDLETAIGDINTTLNNVYKKNETYSISEVDNAISVAVANAPHLKRVIKNSIAEIDVGAEDADQYIYMVPAENAEAGDSYNEYMVIGGVLERVGDWGVDLSDYALASDVNTALGNKVDKEVGKSLVDDNEIAKLLTVAENAEENFVKSVETTQFNVDKLGKLSLIGIDQSLIGGLGDGNNLADLLNSKANASDVETALNNKVDKAEGERLITAAEAKKLESLVIGEGGNIEISGTVNASNVQELYDNVVRIVTGSGTYEYDGVQKTLLGIESGAQVNVIENITLNGGANLEIVDKTVDIPLASGVNAGIVKSSTNENMVAVLAEGTMEVNSLNVNKLVQTAGDVLVLNGGNSAGGYTTE